jgi:hypothetical protein
MAAGTMKIPDPIIAPATIITQSNRPRPWTKPVAGGDAVSDATDGVGTVMVYSAAWAHPTLPMAMPPLLSGIPVET